MTEQRSTKAANQLLQVSAMPHPASNACPLCGAWDAELIASRARGGVELRSIGCRNCGLLRSDPMPSESDLRTFYEQNYRLTYKGVYRPKRKHIFRAGCLAASRLRALSAYINPGDRVLDVGSGGGEWLYALQQRGVVGLGLELDRSYADFARREYGVAVINGSVEDVAPRDDRYQAVTLFHVLEHVPDPVRVLTRCLALLEPKGRLIVEVPNMASRYQHPQNRFHPAHVIGFTPETLSRSAIKAGGSPIELRMDSFSRNVTAIIERRADPSLAVEVSPPADAIDAIRPCSTSAYFASPSTHYRFALRMVQFGREYFAIRRGSSARDILDAILQAP